MRAPLKATETEGKFDIFVNVRGGGTTGQAGAVLLGVARALKSYDEGLMTELRDTGFLTRDSREVERKKPGQRGARRKFQFSKRQREFSKLSKSRLGQPGGFFYCHKQVNQKWLVNTTKYEGRHLSSPHVSSFALEAVL